MWLLVASYVAALALHRLGWGPAVGGWFDTVVNGWFGELTLLAPVAVCWLAIYRAGLRRPEVLLAAGAVTAYAAGDTYYLITTMGGGSLPLPSLADVGYLAVYPLLLAALVIAVHRHAHAVASAVWLDGVVGSLGAAAVLAVVLSPVLASAVAGTGFWAGVVAVTYPLCDLLLVAAVAGIAALGDVRMGSRWALLAGGLLAFAAADVLYGLQSTAGTYVLGSPMDAGWAVGLALMATWVDGTASERLATQRKRRRSHARALAVSSVATVAGLGVLVAGTRVPLSSLAVALAGVTLLAAAARSQLAFRRLAQMAHQRLLTAATDELTGLPNRRALYAEGQRRLLESQGPRHALLMLDLDKFKEVNDSLGHRAGDRLLVSVSSRLREHLREDDMLARLGGDEFAVLLDDAGQDAAAEVAKALCAALDEPFALDDVAVHTGVSIGVALFPDDGADLSTLLRKADVAMYKAKTSSKGHHIYCIADDADDIARLQTMEQLRTALSCDQLVLHYQPKIDLNTGEVHSVEALVRWDHPTRGLLYPDDFLPLVEESGLMPALSRVVLTKALDQVALWRANGRQLAVAVNLSASSLVDSDLPKQVASMLAAREVTPRSLQLEITKEFLMADRDRARTILTRLRSSGVQISVDDFGTGFSSLTYLRDLPIDELKIDRSFISPAAPDDRTTALVTSTIALAHNLGLRMVAEGVETDVDYTELTRLGCDQAQGYFMSRPVPATELDLWLSNRHAPGQASDVPEERTSTAAS
jgi:diguanylate cyclase (GGDEF)-like protein